MPANALLLFEEVEGSELSPAKTDQGLGDSLPSSDPKLDEKPRISRARKR